MAARGMRPRAVGAAAVTQLSKNFRLSEFAVSGSFPHLVEPVPEAFIPNVEKIVGESLQPMRTEWDRSFVITSCYRNAKLNKAVGGSATSQHRSAAAVDFFTADLRALFYWLLKNPNRYPLGQIILYPKKGFMHAALPSRRYPKPTFFVCTGPKKYVRVRTVEEAAALGV